MVKRAAWFVRLGGGDACASRMFAFPYSGGSPGSYAHWNQWRDPEMDLWALQAPGRAARMAEPPIADMRELVDELAPHLLPLLDRPYLLFGHSNGALVAFAVANRLLQLGVRRPSGIILSGKRSPSRPAVQERVSMLPDQDFLARLRDLNGTPKELLENPEIMSLFFPVIRADFSVGETYVLEKTHPLLCAIPALVLAGHKDSIAVEDVFSWKDIFHKAKARLLEGDHFFINTDPAFPALVQDFYHSECHSSTQYVE